jgi:hypothetical protein
MTRHAEAPKPGNYPPLVLENSTNKIALSKVLANSELQARCRFGETKTEKEPCSYSRPAKKVEGKKQNKAPSISPQTAFSHVFGRIPITSKATEGAVCHL